MTLWRFQFTEKNIEKGKRFLKGENQTEPAFLKGRKGEIKNGKLHIDGKLVIPKEKVDIFLRNKVLQGKVPMSRDGLYYYLSKISVGIRRAAIDSFLKKQHIIRETDNLQPSSKKNSRKVQKKGQIQFDLVEINWKDVGFTPTDKSIEKEAGYIYTCADALTGLLFAKFAPNKDHETITPIAKEAFEWFADKLQTPISKMFALSDKGSEWEIQKYKEWGLRVKFVARAPLIEQKNSQIQRALYRIIKMKNTKNISKLVKNAMTIVNRTQSSLTKVAPIEAISESASALAKRYNKKRGKGSGQKLKARVLKIGEMVRVQIVSDKKRGGEFFKAYKGESYSKRRYKILAKKGNRYKIHVAEGKKFFHRDQLRPTEAPDPKTIRILHEREKAAYEKDKRETAKRRKEEDAQLKKRPQRASKLKAKQKIRASTDADKYLERHFD